MNVCSSLESLPLWGHVRLKAELIVNKSVGYLSEWGIDALCKFGLVKIKCSSA